MNDMRKLMLDYLNNQKDICEEAMAAYVPGAIQDTDAEIRKMRASQEIVLRDRVTELKKHIKVFEMMVPKL